MSHPATYRDAESFVGDVLTAEGQTGARLKLAYARLFTSGGWRAVAKTFRLSPRELDVAILVTKGFTDAQIAGALGLAKYSVPSFVGRVFAKLHVHNRSRACLKMLLVLEDAAQGQEI